MHVILEKKTKEKHSVSEQNKSEIREDSNDDDDYINENNIKDSESKKRSCDDTKFNKSKIYI